MKRSSRRPLRPSLSPRPRSREAEIEDGFHRLSERLQSAAIYLEILRAALDGGPEPASPAEMANKASHEISEAQDVFRHLRDTALNRTGAAKGDGAGRDYRICFMNRLSRGGDTNTACQRSVVVRAAASPEHAIENAKQRFAEIEGVGDCSIHAAVIAVEPLEAFWEDRSDTK